MTTEEQDLEMEAYFKKQEDEYNQATAHIENVLATMTIEQQLEEYRKHLVREYMNNEY